MRKLIGGEKSKENQVIEILKEILKWIKVTSIPQVKKLLLELLPSDEEKIAYHFSDGRSSREVAKVSGVNYVTITRWWKTWIKAGIAEYISVKGGKRAKKLFLLEDFGIPVPSRRERESKEETHSSREEKGEGEYN